VRLIVVRLAKLDAQRLYKKVKSTWQLAVDRSLVGDAHEGVAPDLANDYVCGDSVNSSRP
jgi:hypothetical protein